MTGYLSTIKLIARYLSTYGIVNQEDTINVTLSGVANHDTEPLQPSFNFTGLKVKGRKSVKINTPSPCRCNQML